MKFGDMTTEVKRSQMMISHFSVNIIGSEFQPMGFLTFDLFTRLSKNRLKRSFRRLYLPKFRGFIKKRKTSNIFCYKNKYTNKFHALTIKTDFKICQKIRNLDGEIS